VARPPAEHTTQVRQRLLARLDGGQCRPGDRFLSARAIAQQFGISYQTAHRLLRGLADEGRLEIRPQSGAFVAGGLPPLRGVDLVLHPRARRRHSFGSRLRSELAAALDAAGIDHATRWDGGRAVLRGDRLPVMWEAPHALARCIERQRWGLLINDRAPFGMRSQRIDSVSLDDFSGGACAAELLVGRRKRARRGRYAVLAGPRDDRRNRQRVEGFTSLLKARVVYAGGWYFEDGRRAAGEAVRFARDGLFCCNDRLAEAALACCRDEDIPPPPIVGFDNAPVAERLNLTTIAIPWQELIGDVTALIRRRLRGDTAASSQRIIAPRPLVRGAR